MSQTSLIIFAGGIPDSVVEFSNAWGGAARIWDSLFNAHIPKRHQYDTWLSGGRDDRRLWDLATNEGLQMFERAVHAFTFDLFYVRQDHFARFINDLALFAEKYPVPGRVDHLPAWAKWFGENMDVEAVGLHGTSVAENIWWRSKTCTQCGNSTDEQEPVPLSEGIEVYDWLERLKPKPQVA